MPANASTGPAGESAFLNHIKANAGVYGKEFGISSIMGAAVGVATRRLTSDALYGAGLAFAGLQCLSYVGFITIHWNVIQKYLEEKADLNKDGKLDMEDVKIFVNRTLTFLSRGLPDVAGFTSGFLFGIKYLA